MKLRRSTGAPPILSASSDAARQHRRRLSRPGRRRAEAGRPGPALKALGALSDYLAWTSGGGPYDRLIPKTKRALAQTGDADEVPAFEARLDQGAAAENAGDPRIGRWQAAASLKLCVDGAIDRVNARSSEALPRSPDAQRSGAQRLVARHPLAVHGAGRQRPADQRLGVGLGRRLLRRILAGKGLARAWRCGSGPD